MSNTIFPDMAKGNMVSYNCSRFRDSTAFIRRNGNPGRHNRTENGSGRTSPTDEAGIIGTFADGVAKDFDRPPYSNTAQCFPG